MTLPPMLSFLIYCIQVVFAALVLLLGKILFSLPLESIQNVFIDRFKKLTSIENEADFLEGLFSWEMFKLIKKQTWIDSFKAVNCGSPVEDGWELIKISPTMDENMNVIETDTSDAKDFNIVSIKSMVKENVPLVLNFGSRS